MSIHVCKQCGRRFEYCRQCVFKPIRHMDAGFCSKECSAAFKIKEEVVPTEDVELVVIEEGTSTQEEIVEEYPYLFTAIEEENNTDDNEQSNAQDVRTIGLCIFDEPDTVL